MTGSGKILWHKSEFLLFVLQGREGWREVTQAEKGPLPAVSRHGAPVTGCEPGPGQRMQPAGLQEVTSEVAFCRATPADALTEGGRYLFGILPGRSVSCPCTSFM